MIAFELIPADREDRVRIEAAEGAQAHELVVPLPLERPRARPGREGSADPVGLFGDGDARAVRTLEQATVGGRGQPVRRGDDLVEEPRQVAARGQLDLLPDSHLRLDGASPVSREVGGHALEPAGDRLEPLVQRRMVAGEEREEGVAHRRRSGGVTLPRSNDIAVEERQPEVVQLEVALESRLRGESGCIQGLDRGEVMAIALDLFEGGVARRIAELIVPRVDPEVGRRDRVALDAVAESGLDEVVERIVERPLFSGRRRPRELDAAQCPRRHGQRATAAAAVSVPAAAAVSVPARSAPRVFVPASAPAHVPDVDASARRTAPMVVSMSSASTP